MHIGFGRVAALLETDTDPLPDGRGEVPAVGGDAGVAQRPVLNVSAGEAASAAKAVSADAMWAVHVFGPGLWCETMASAMGN